MMGPMMMKKGKMIIDMLEGKGMELDDEMKQEIMSICGGPKEDMEEEEEEDKESVSPPKIALILAKLKKEKEE